MRTAIIVVLVFSISALVMLTSTETITLFSGSHHISDISSASNDISCTSCHSRIHNELSRSQVHEDLDCVDCHRLEETASGEKITYAVHNESGWQPGNESHAAYTPRCLDCHGGNGVQVGTKFAPPAPAFNQTGYGSDYSAHKPFLEYANSSGMSVGANEGCIACHTNYSFKFDFNRPKYFEFVIKWQNGCSNGCSGSRDWYIDSINYGSTNTTTVVKPGNGAKHEFVASNKIKCGDCHSDIWQAANHPESNNYNSTRASHVCWKWGGSKGCKSVSIDNPMHNISYVGKTPGYDNVTDYCLSSCHNPIINQSADKPLVFDEKVHASYKLSCYHCHNSTIYEGAFLNKAKPGYDTPGFWRDSSTNCDDKHSGHDNIDDSVLSKPLFLHAETCISCKRGSCQSCHDDDCMSGDCGADYPHYKTWTEPNNTMYHYNDSRYI